MEDVSFNKCNVCLYSNAFWLVDPDAPEQPTVGFQNSSLIEVKWRKPKVPRGEIDFYSVRVKGKLMSNNETREENLTGMNFIIFSVSSNIKSLTKINL